MDAEDLLEELTRIRETAFQRAWNSHAAGCDCCRQGPDDDR